MDEIVVCFIFPGIASVLSPREGTAHGHDSFDEISILIVNSMGRTILFSNSSICVLMQRLQSCLSLGRGVTFSVIILAAPFVLYCFTVGARLLILFIMICLFMIYSTEERIRNMIISV